MIDKIYVVATTWQGTSLNIEHFYTPHKALKKISEIAIKNGFIKPDPTDDPEKYMNDYKDYLIENLCYISPEMDVSLHIINLEKKLSNLSYWNFKRESLNTEL